MLVLYFEKHRGVRLGNIVYYVKSKTNALKLCSEILLVFLFLC